MSEMTNNRNTEAENLSVRDIWFRGTHSVLPSGEITYFICQYLKEIFPDAPGEPSYMVCTQRDTVVDNIAGFCNMDCEHFGMCRTCRGFSADRCHQCFIPRDE